MERATREELDRYREKGFFWRERAFSESEIGELREAADRVHQKILEAAEKDDAPPVDRIDNQRYQMLLGSTIKWEWREDSHQIRSMEPFFHLHPRFDALVDDPRLWGPCRDLIGTERLSLFSDKLNFKRPGGSPFPWHQESPYWAHGCEQLGEIVTAMIHLDDASRENGCLWVIPGSHRHGVLPGLEDRGVLGRLYTDVSRFGPDAGMPVEVPAGSVLFFHSDIVHGSKTNHTGVERRVLILAYQAGGLRRWRLEKTRPVGL